MKPPKSGKPGRNNKTCAFCKKFKYRSQKQRNDHATKCIEK